MSAKEMVSVRIPKEMNAQLTSYLKPIGITKNAFIISLLQRELKKANGKGYKV